MDQVAEDQEVYFKPAYYMLTLKRVNDRLVQILLSKRGILTQPVP